MIAVDLDGTLSTLKANFLTFTIETIKKISKKATVVIATGRPYRMAKDFITNLNSKRL